MRRIPAPLGHHGECRQCVSHASYRAKGEQSLPKHQRQPRRHDVEHGSAQRIPFADNMAGPQTNRRAVAEEIALVHVPKIIVVAPQSGKGLGNERDRQEAERPPTKSVRRVPAYHWLLIHDGPRSRLSLATWVQSQIIFDSSPSTGKANPANIFDRWLVWPVPHFVSPKRKARETKSFYFFSISVCDLMIVFSSGNVWNVESIRQRGRVSATT